MSACTEVPGKPTFQYMESVQGDGCVCLSAHVCVCVCIHACMSIPKDQEIINNNIATVLTYFTISILRILDLFQIYFQINYLLIMDFCTSQFLFIILYSISWISTDLIKLFYYCYLLSLIVENRSDIKSHHMGVFFETQNIHSAHKSHSKTIFIPQDKD